MNRPTVLTPGTALLLNRARRRASAAERRARAERRLKLGTALVVGGWVIALAGVVLYCVASFAGESDADLAAILLHGAVPAARAGLFVVGGGTLLWIVGSVLHAGAALDGAAGREGSPDDSPRP